MGNLLRSSTGDTNPLDADGAGASSSPTFITTQSLVTFPVATTAVTIIWKLIQLLFAEWADRAIVPVVIALGLGAFIAWYGAEEDAWANLSAHRRRRMQAAAVVIGIVNALFLAAAAVGIDKTL